MAQLGMFPLTAEEFKQTAKELADKIAAWEETEADKDTTSRQFNEKIKRLRGEIRQRAQVVKEEKVSREASEEEAPWQGLVDEAEAIAKRGRRRRDRTGDVVEEGPDGEGSPEGTG